MARVSHRECRSARARPGVAGSHLQLVDEDGDGIQLVVGAGGVCHDELALRSGSLGMSSRVSRQAATPSWDNGVGSLIACWGTVQSINANPRHNYAMVKYQEITRGNGASAALGAEPGRRADGRSSSALRENVRGAGAPRQMGFVASESGSWKLWQVIFAGPGNLRRWWWWSEGSREKAVRPVAGRRFCRLPPAAEEPVGLSREPPSCLTATNSGTHLVFSYLPA